MNNNEDYCPYCSCDPILISTEEYYSVNCSECDYKTPLFKSKEKAEQTWRKQQISVMAKRFGVHKKEANKLKTFIDNMTDKHFECPEE